MKVCVSADGFTLPDSKNITVYPGLDTYCNLDRDVDDAQAVEIVAKGVLQYAEFSQVPTVLRNLVKKLRHGGSLTVTFLDAWRCMAKAMDTELADLNTTLYGQTPPVRSILEDGFVHKCLQELGLNVIKVERSGGTSVMTASRV